MDNAAHISMEYLMRVTGICAADIEATLKLLNILKVKGSQRSLHVTPEHLRRFEVRRLAKLHQKDHYRFHKTLLSWSCEQYVEEAAHVTTAGNSNVVPLLLGNDLERKRPRTQS
jgi:hypothetical protein